MQDDLIKHLQQGVVVLEFIKADQSVRRMRATLNTSYLPVRPEHAQAAKNASHLGRCQGDVSFEMPAPIGAVMTAHHIFGKVSAAHDQ